ncbi:MAG: protoheme IX farnesyltransferase [Bacteroidetes bacterium]|nr:protoheme IX farnesyltransferase [Bacteroidota bacterium]
MQKIKDYKELSKFTLSFTVVFTCIICYLLVPNVHFLWVKVIELFVAGMLVCASANAINQAVEKDTDAQMKRTAKRPVASGRMSVNEALTFATIAGIVGCIMMWYFFNPASALISAFSLFLYAFIYTPLKKVNSISVLVGAFPGALPCMIVWVAGYTPEEQIGWTGALVVFAIQFIWQFPHFWAIAWVAHQDYTKVGFKLLPSKEGPTKYTAIQAIMYSVLMIPIGILPFISSIAISGKHHFINDTTLATSIGLWILVVANVFMVVQCYRLYKDMDVKAARRVMFSSYIYLPIVYLALLWDKM